MSHKATLLGAAASMVLLVSGIDAANARMNGWYLNIEGGANWVEDFKVHAFTGPLGGVVTTTTRLNFEMDSGWAGIASAGYGFGDHWRVELEGGYRHNKMDKAVYLVPPASSPAGNLTEWTIMANVAYDLMLTERFGLSFGVGAGADDARFSFRSTGGTANVHDDDWRFAYQGIVGLNYQLGPQTKVTLNYRYLRVDAPEWNGGATAGPSFIRFESDDLTKHTVTIGLRYDLWPDEEQYETAAAPPPAQELPPAPPAQSFMIFFGFNRCNITPEADNVLSQAAQAAHQMGTVTVQIVGHTDTKGTQSYNQTLSQCRARAAKSNMVGKGVPANSIATSGKGETELLVQTADGVKEPQNRRATIDLQ